MSSKNIVFKDLIGVLSDKEIYYTFKSIVEDDCYVDEFMDDGILEVFLQFMVYYNIVWTTSDKRILLTSKGENLFQEIALAVEIPRKSSKIKKNKKIWKHKPQTNL